MIDGSNRARILKADKDLEDRIGSGPLDPVVVANCQKIMDSNTVDFGPLADEYLAELSVSVEQARKREGEDRDLIQNLVEPVMQLKANASMFNYELLGDLANIMLSFLNAIDQIDEDVTDIVEAHHTTLSLIIKSRMDGDGGLQGDQLRMELNDACRRYFFKKREAS